MSSASGYARRVAEGMTNTAGAHVITSRALLISIFDAVLCIPKDPEPFLEDLFGLQSHPKRIGM